MLKLNRKGTTRIVLLTNKYAFKFANIKEYRLFLHGLLANLQEKHFSGLHENLNKTLFSFPLGLCNIQYRTKELNKEEFFNLNYEKFTKHNNLTLPVENKLDSFGWLNNKIVAVDYGS